MNARHWAMVFKWASLMMGSNCKAIGYFHYQLNRNSKLALVNSLLLGHVAIASFFEKAIWSEGLTVAEFPVNWACRLWLDDCIKFS